MTTTQPTLLQLSAGLMLNRTDTQHLTTANWKLSILQGGRKLTGSRNPNWGISDLIGEF